MDELLQIFGKIPLSDVIIFIAAMGFLVTIGMKVYKIIVSGHDAIQEKENLLEQLQKDIKEIKDNPTVTREEWKILKSKQNSLESVLNEILKTQKILAEKQENFEAENKAHNLNKLRDRLIQSYRYYTSEEKNPLKAWSEMEQEAFNNLFEDYETLGGNGFMHSTVAPAMSALEVISMSNQDKITELMKSRRG